MSLRINSLLAFFILISGFVTQQSVAGEHKSITLCILPPMTIDYVPIAHLGVIPYPQYPCNKINIVDWNDIKAELKILQDNQLNMVRPTSEIHRVIVDSVKQQVLKEFSDQQLI